MKIQNLGKTARTELAKEYKNKKGKRETTTACTMIRSKQLYKDSQALPFRPSFSLCPIFMTVFVGETKPLLFKTFFF